MRPPAQAMTPPESGPGTSVPRPASRYRDHNSTAEQALDILRLFTCDKPTWSGAELAAHLGVARSTGYRYLQSLVGRGFVEEAPHGFRLGPRVFELAGVARAGIGLSDIALPIMHALADRVDETVLLTRRSGRSIVCLDLVQTRGAVQLTYERDQVLPINAGAAAAVLLAWTGAAELADVLKAAPLERFTSNTLTSPDELRARLVQIRKRGVAVSRGELDKDILGIAAPIRDVSGSVCAAISLAAPARGVHRSRLDVFTVAVRNAAADVSRQLAVVDAAARDRTDSHRIGHSDAVVR
ncbi:IclR family transcriptional regulator [Nocardia asteroides]|uniref:IclR family transcriptional regulator n=1 Tax=Nocardia asteroides TaxID=1824 RepID=UPI0033BFC88E